MTSKENWSEASRQNERKEGQIAVPNVDIIVISGPSAVGKTGIGELLARWYGVPSVEAVKLDDPPAPRFVRAGVMMREWFKEQEQRDSIGFIDRTEDVDRMLDKLQEYIMNQASVDGAPLILEGRLAGYLLRRLKEDPNRNFDKTSVSLLVTADDEVRRDRIIPRERIKLDRYSTDELINIYGNDEPSDDDIWRVEEVRRIQDLINWQNLHPNLVDPFNPELFDEVIDTEQYNNSDESAMAVHEYLLATKRVIEF